MDKRIVLAVAGSGKTRSIIESLSLDKRSIIITYTNNNYDNLRSRIVDKFGFIPDNISLYTYFSFLYSFCYLPCLFYKIGSRTINYNEEHKSFPRKGVGSKDVLWCMDYSGGLLGNRLALLVKNHAIADVKARLEKFYDQLVIDEVQDFSANDFNLINELANTNVDILYVGDYFQHTYDTSVDGNTRKKLYLKGYDEYKKELNTSLTVDESSLLKSYRCSMTTCKYIADNLDIAIEASNEIESIISIIDSNEEIEQIANNPEVPKLFYQGHANYRLFSTNWGASKGIDHFNDVCVVLNATTWPMVRDGNLGKIVPSTRNKLYVAITRAHRNVYFIEEKKLVSYKISKEIM